MTLLLLPKVDIYTDGSCLGNPGHGGWAAKLIHHKTGSEKIISESWDEETTNNEMELMAIYMGIRALKGACNVNIYSDSRYCINVLSGRSRAHKNTGLVIAIQAAMKGHKIDWHYVPGHSGNHHNEDVDKAAVSAAKVAQNSKHGGI